MHDLHPHYRFLNFHSSGASIGVVWHLHFLPHVLSTLCFSVLHTYHVVPQRAFHYINQPIQPMAPPNAPSTHIIFSIEFFSWRGELIVDLSSPYTCGIYKPFGLTPKGPLSPNGLFESPSRFLWCQFSIIFFEIFTEDAEM